MSVILVINSLCRFIFAKHPHKPFEENIKFYPPDFVLLKYELPALFEQFESDKYSHLESALINNIDGRV